MGTSLGIIKMNHVSEQRRRQRDADMLAAAETWVFTERLRAAYQRARRILGKGYISFVEALPDEFTNLQMCEALEAVKEAGDVPDHA